MPTIHAQYDPPLAADDFHHLRFQGADGLDSIQIRLRWTPEGGTRAVLRLLGQVFIETVLAVRRAQDPTTGPKLPRVAQVHVTNREHEGSRWHG